MSWINVQYKRGTIFFFFSYFAMQDRIPFGCGRNFFGSMLLFLLFCLILYIYIYCGCLHISYDLFFYVFVLET